MSANLSRWPGKLTALYEAADTFVAEFEVALICHQGNDSLVPRSALPAWLELRKIAKELRAIADAESKRNV